MKTSKSVQQLDDGKKATNQSIGSILHNTILLMKFVTLNFTGIFFSSNGTSIQHYYTHILYQTNITTIKNTYSSNKQICFLFPRSSRWLNFITVTYSNQYTFALFAFIDYLQTRVACAEMCVTNLLNICVYEICISDFDGNETNVFQSENGSRSKSTHMPVANADYRASVV